MNQGKKFLFGVRVFIVILFIGFVLIILRRENHWEFKEGSNVLANPDRGFYIQIDSCDYERIPDAAKEVRVIFLAFDMEEYIYGDISEDKLNELQCALNLAQEEHTSVIFRAAYGYHDNISEPDKIERMGRHIEQIAEILNCYADQILVVQAGMLGEYGEWHSSRYLEGEEGEDRKSRLYILKQWETYLNPQIKVAVRRPRFIREAIEEKILMNRLGFHNDALLSTEDDMGTYDDPEMERMDEIKWVQNNLSGQINGGEMPLPGELSLPENADREFAGLHISYLNLKYNEAVLAQWAETDMKEMNAKSYLENHLGYRLFVSEIDMRKISLEKELYADGIQMNLSLCNTGYAPISSKYKIFLSLDFGNKRTFQEVKIPEIYSICNGQTLKKEITVRLPKESVQNSEKVSIGLKIAPDMETESNGDCVRLANQEFSYHNGVNDIVFVRKTAEFFLKPSICSSEE